jgi:hypothetical protein
MSDQEELEEEDSHNGEEAEEDGSELADDVEVLASFISIFPGRGVNTAASQGLIDSFYKPLS